jgi:hypothetical protein
VQLARPIVGLRVNVGSEERHLGRRKMTALLGAKSSRLLLNTS